MPTLRFPLTIVGLFWLASSIFAQLRIDPSGRIGIGTTIPNSGYKVHIKGDLLLTTYPEVPVYPGNTFIEMKMKVGNGNPGAEIGANVDKIAFWSSETDWNEIYVESVYQMSDSSKKMNIHKIHNARVILNQLNGYKYEIKNHGDANIPTRYGLIAQEVRRVMPEATDSAKGILMVDYNQMIPLLIVALNAEMNKLDSLEEELKKLQIKLIECCDARFASDVLKSAVDKDLPHARLYQNNPNPFWDRTVVDFELPLTRSSSASIMIMDLNGRLEATYPIKGRGRGSITIDGKQLVPGMYLYSLIIDGVEIETRRMIITE